MSLPADVRVATAGVVLRYENCLVFQVGFGTTKEALGVVRIGGHLEPGESLAECARREVYEEAGVDAHLVESPRTFTYRADARDVAITEEGWKLAPPTPLFAVRAAVSRARHDLSVTFLALDRGLSTAS